MSPLNAPRFHHVVLRAGADDLHSPTLGRDSVKIDAAIDRARGNKFIWVRDRVWCFFDAYRAAPPEPALDLYRIAAAAYTADLRVARAAAFDGWTRELVLHVPVTEYARWEPAVGPLEQLLRFLSGDRWTLVLRDQRVPRPPVNPKNDGIRAPLQADTVCLLSGGLDSFIGAIDAAADGAHLALVSHNALGPHKFSSGGQRQLVRALRGRFGERRPAHFQFFFDPPRVQEGVTAAENSQRGRSFLFLALGTLVASALGPGTPLIVPENGFITLNVPLTAGRLGSWSTRTTHPHAIALFRQVLALAAIDVRVETPYRFRTKGTMLAECRDQELLARHVDETNSCGHANDRNAREGRGEPQCGYCVPCIIRRASLHAARLPDGEYRYDVQTERGALTDVTSRDLRAFEIAIARARARTPTITDVLRAGPLDAAPGEVADYVGVYRGGLEEVSRFLTGAPVGP